MLTSLGQQSPEEQGVFKAENLSTRVTERAFILHLQFNYLNT
jgi:hypothetical protein